MKRELKWTAVASVLVMSLGGASAQAPARTDRADGFSQSLPYPDYVKGRDVRASELVGERVRNADGESLGEIEELVIPTRGHDDMLVILSVGGVLDVDDKLVALPYHDLRVSADGDTLYIDRTEEQLEAAPVFTYDVDAHADAGTQARSTQRAPGAADRTASTTPNAPSAKAAKADNVVLDVFDHRASDLIGAAVLDDRGENVGKLDDIVVSTDDDKLHAVIAIGGFAGFGAKRISLPFDDLQITATDRPQVRIPMTGEQLQQLVDSRGEFRYERQVARAPADAPRG
jgi:sporulation protein YlmC with PRC-barrel domain